MIVLSNRVSCGLPYHDCQLPVDLSRYFGAATHDRSFITTFAVAGCPRLLPSNMAGAMVTLKFRAASLLVFSALGMHRAVVPAGVGGGGRGGRGGGGMLMTAAAAMYEATGPRLPPIGDNENHLHCSHGKTADENCTLCSGIVDVVLPTTITLFLPLSPGRKGRSKRWAHSGA